MCLFELWFSQGILPGSGIAGSYGNFIPSFFKESPYCSPTSLVAQMLKRLPGMQETWVRSLGQEDPLEKEMATHSSTLVWRIPWREILVGYSPWGRKESDTTERLQSLMAYLFLACFGEHSSCSP